MSNAALIVAAGKGDRLGHDMPKQYLDLGGKAMLAHSVDIFLAHPAISTVFVVIAAGQEEMAKSALHERKIDGVVTGGLERHDSVRIGLKALRGKGVTKVLIHDAARPFLPHDLIDRLLSALDDTDGAVPALPVVDTLAYGKGVLGDVVDRNQLLRIQTPQAFRFDAIMTSHDLWNAGVATDDAQIARNAGYAVSVVAGDPALEKITHAADLSRANSSIAANRSFRTGQGFDVHRLQSGKDLWLCGLKLESTVGLAGHSDADVALHALVDALLGAIGEGDIGAHFPPGDAQWKGAPSHVFVTHACQLVDKRGAQIENVDLTIICEEPKIGPHREAMRSRLAELLHLEIDRISVKATTTEGLGLTGRREGIAAQAIATVRI